jgi:Right handed beta helix region/Domain of unknown function DUF11
MSRAALLLAGVLMALNAAAADLQIAPLDWPVSGGSFGGNGSVRGVLRVTNAGPEQVDDAVMTIVADPEWTKVVLAAPIRTRCENRECRFDPLPPGEHRDVVLYITAPFLRGQVTITATVTASAADPAPRNNVAAPTVQFIDEGPDLMLGLQVTSPAALRRGFSPLTSIPPDETAFLEVGVANTGELAATDVVVRVTFPDGSRVTSFESAQFECNLATAHAVCRAPSVPRHESGQPAFRIRFAFLSPPFDQGARLEFRAEASAAEYDRNPGSNSAHAEVAINRFFAVTITADSGPGSLRQAILDANAQCRELFVRGPGAPSHAQLCTLGFRIPGPLPESGFFTIQPLSPLPPVNFIGTIDGLTQATWLGAATSLPRIMLDGSRLAGDTSGLTIIGGSSLRQLAIGNFPGDGVLIERRPQSNTQHQAYLLENVHLGVDPSGEVAAPNERGVVGMNTAFSLESSIVSANRRSGVVVMGAGGTFRNNRIGVAAGSNRPLPNGASGIFLHGSLSATVSGNVIANHPHFGVATDMPSAQRELLITRNSIYDNGYAIDYGLDGPTPNAGFDATRFPNHPVIDRVRYDTVRGETVIDVSVVTAARPSLFEWCPSYGSYPCLFTKSEAEVEVYANSGPGSHARRYLGTVEMGQLIEQSASLSGTLAVKEDLRGWWISGVTLRERQDCYTDTCKSSRETSEASVGVEVRR